MTASSEQIRLAIATPSSGSPEIFEMCTSSTVDTLKDCIHERLGHEQNRQVLIFNKKPLEDGSTMLTELGISDNSKLVLLLKELPSMIGEWTVKWSKPPMFDDTVEQSLCDLMGINRNACSEEQLKDLQNEVQEARDTADKMEELPELKLVIAEGLGLFEPVDESAEYFGPEKPFFYGSLNHLEVLPGGQWKATVVPEFVPESCANPSLQISLEGTYSEVRAEATLAAPSKNEPLFESPGLGLGSMFGFKWTLTKVHPPK